MGVLYYCNTNPITAMGVKVSRSRNLKQKVYEILTSPKIQTNGVILNNCIDQVCLCFDRLLLLNLSAVQVLHTQSQYLTTVQNRKKNISFGFWEKFRHDNFVSRSTDLYTVFKVHLADLDHRSSRSGHVDNTQCVKERHSFERHS